VLQGYGAHQFSFSSTKFKAAAIGIFERILLGRKNSDHEEDRMVQGVGGGYRKEANSFTQLSGDDPIYVALGASLVFLGWALSGGLSLH
jgi:hypothetical protein